jgi:probable rRNA maturation factor
MAITFTNLNTDYKLKNTREVIEWVKSVIVKERKKPGTITFVFTDDATLLRKNKSYLNHDTLTDILTFDYTEEKNISGDILISIERVYENADKFRTTFENELLRVMIHGVYHLCGYKDKSKSQQELMRKKEDGALRLFQQRGKTQ